MGETGRVGRTWGRLSSWTSFGCFGSSCSVTNTLPAFKSRQFFCNEYVIQPWATSQQLPCSNRTLWEAYHCIHFHRPGPRPGFQAKTWKSEDPRDPEVLTFSEDSEWHCRAAPKRQAQKTSGSTSQSTSRAWQSRILSVWKFPTEGSALHEPIGRCPDPANRTCTGTLLGTVQARKNHERYTHSRDALFESTYSRLRPNGLTSYYLPRKVVLNLHLCPKVLQTLGPEKFIKKEFLYSSLPVLSESNTDYEGLDMPSSPYRIFHHFSYFVGVSFGMDQTNSKVARDNALQSTTLGAHVASSWFIYLIGQADRRPESPKRN